MIPKNNEIDFDSRTKSRICFACLFAKCIGNMMIQNIVSFLPLFVQSNDWDESSSFQINERSISFIIAIFSIASCIFSPINSFFKNKLGAKNTILFGFTLITVNSFGLGYISRIKNPKEFLVIALIMRFF